ncbi:dihydroneopterin aldolase [Leucothrix sargassi]|nr:dihydroneopterin aldolase [Leucothrix sargassi]
MDIVYIRDLRVDACIGIYDWERKIRQQIRIDLDMGWDNRPAANTDDIQYTLNYKEAAKLVENFVLQSDYQLVETLAEKIAELLLTDMKLPWVKVSLGKPVAVSGSQEVGVIIERFAPEAPSS